MTLARPCSVSVIIFTLDEEVNLPHCFASLQWCDDIIVVDSGSTDRTVQIARDAGARVFAREFDGFGSQRNWAIDNTEPVHDWILILDADERVTDQLAREINQVASSADVSISAARLRRRFYMWGKWLKHSSLYPTWVVRLIRSDRVRYVNRGHAETQQVEGKTIALENDLVDENHKGEDHWYQRQRKYALKDAEYELASSGSSPTISALLGTDPLQRKMALKQLSWNMPLRPLVYFTYSYILRMGFLDGKHGLKFCFMRSRYQAMVVANKRKLRKQEADRGPA